MEIKEGIYVRTKDGHIGKVVEIIYINEEKRYSLDSTNVYLFADEDIIGEPSYEIIKLLKPGDIVTLSIKHCEGEIYRVINVYDDIAVVDCFMDGYMNVDNNDIKSVVTKEQFEKCMYEVQHESII